MLPDFLDPSQLCLEESFWRRLYGARAGCGTSESRADELLALSGNSTVVVVPAAAVVAVGRRGRLLARRGRGRLSPRRVFPDFAEGLLTVAGGSVAAEDA